MLQKPDKSLLLCPDPCCLCFQSEAVTVLSFTPINLLCEVCGMVWFCGIPWLLTARTPLCWKNPFRQTKERTGKDQFNEPISLLELFTRSWVTQGNQSPKKSYEKCVGSYTTVESPVGLCIAIPLKSPRGRFLGGYPIGDFCQRLSASYVTQERDRVCEDLGKAFGAPL